MHQSVITEETNGTYTLQNLLDGNNLLYLGLIDGSLIIAWSRAAQGLLYQLQYNSHELNSRAASALRELELPNSLKYGYAVLLRYVCRI